MRGLANSCLSRQLNGCVNVVSSASRLVVLEAEPLPGRLLVVSHEGGNRELLGRGSTAQHDYDVIVSVLFRVHLRLPIVAQTRPCIALTHTLLLLLLLVVVVVVALLLLLLLLTTLLPTIYYLLPTTYYLLQPSI